MTDMKESRPSLKGLRHLALRVSDMAAARAFYQELLGMTVVWEPDPENVYLTSGCDNLALHLMSEVDRAAFSPAGQTMDHLVLSWRVPRRFKRWRSRWKRRGYGSSSRSSVTGTGAARFTWLIRTET